MFRPVLFLALALFGLSACQTASTGEDTDMLKIDGAVTYLERVALPPGSVITVNLIDASIADRAAPVLASQRIEAEGQNVPIPFALEVERAALTERGRYNVRAEIRGADDQLMWTTDTAYPVDISGETASLGMLRMIRVGGARTATPVSGPLNLVIGREWVVEDINAAGVIDNARTTLTFGEDGRLSGSGGCNSFTGSYSLDQGRLSIGPVAATKKACPPALMDQEAKFFAVLRDAASVAYQRVGDSIVISTADGRTITAR